MARTVAMKSENEFATGLASDGTKARSGAGGPRRFSLTILDLKFASPASNIFHSPMPLPAVRIFTAAAQPAQNFPFAKRRTP